MMEVPPAVVPGNGGEGRRLPPAADEGQATPPGAKGQLGATTDPETEESWIVIPEEDPNMVLEEDFVIDFGEQRLEILPEEPETVAGQEKERSEAAIEEDLSAETPVSELVRTPTPPEDDSVKANPTEKSWVMPPIEKQRETMAATEEWLRRMTPTAGESEEVTPAKENSVTDIVLLEEDLTEVSLAGRVLKSKIPAGENSMTADGELLSKTPYMNDSQIETPAEENSVTDNLSAEDSRALTPTGKVSEIPAKENSVTDNLEELMAVCLAGKVSKSEIPAEKHSMTSELHGTTPATNDPQTVTPAEEESVTATRAEEDTKPMTKAEGDSTKVTPAEEKSTTVPPAEYRPVTADPAAAIPATRDNLQPGTPDHTFKPNPTAQLLLAASRVEEGDACNLVEALVETGADLEATSTEAEEEGLRPLHLACWGGNTAMVKQLLHFGADPISLATGRQPVHWAAYGGHVGALEALAAVGVSLNPRTAEDASTPLHLAAENGNEAAVRWLVGRGVSVLTRRRDGAWAARLAGEAGHRGLQAYLRHRGKAEQLLTAAAAGNTQAVRQLLARGAEVNDCSYIERTRGWSALHLAAEGDKLATVEALLEAGANVEARAFDGLTAIHVAARTGSLRVLQVLLPRLPVHITNDPGLGLVHAAAEVGDVSILQYLQSCGCDIHARNIQGGQTALHVATRLGHVQATKWLLQEGLSAEEGDAAGLTALDYAWTAGHEDVLIAIAFR